VSCAHDYHFFAWTHGGKTAFDRCALCGYERSRQATSAEEREYHLSYLRSFALHRVSLALNRVLRRYTDDSGGIFGYEAQVAAEQFAADHRDHVRIVPVDDDVFATSVLVLVDHRNDQEYMGTSVLFIPQCGGSSARFFLYPNHRRALLRSLQDIEARWGRTKPRPATLIQRTRDRIHQIASHMSRSGQTTAAMSSARPVCCLAWFWYVSYAW